MKSYWCSQMPERYSGDDPEELKPEELQVIEDAGFDAAWYWYYAGGYDGSGYALLTKPGDAGLYVYYMGHCSCYGPVDHIGDADRWASLDDLKSGATPDLLSDLAPLIEMYEAFRRKV